MLAFVAFMEPMDDTDCDSDSDSDDDEFTNEQRV